MNGYVILLFLHILGAVGMFAAWAIEVVTLRRLREALTVKEAQISMQLFKKQGLMGPVSMIIAVVTGIWMAMLRWTPHPWMGTSFIAVVVIIIIGITFLRRRMPRLRAIFAEEPEQLPDGFVNLLTPLVASARLRIAIGVGILGLMAVRPGISGTLIIIGSATGIGIILAVFSGRQKMSSTKQEAGNI